MKKQTIEDFRKNRMSDEELKEFLEMAKGAEAEALVPLMDEDMESFVPSPNEPDIVVEDRVKRNLRAILFTKTPHIGIWKKVAVIAASLLVPLLIFGNIYFYNKATSTPAASLTAVSASNKNITTVSLPDGSEVQINAGSSIKYDSNDFGNDAAKIAFEGEGLFHIVKAPHRPFTINADQVDVTVYGTTFNFQAYKESPSAKLSLMDGSVAMTSKKTGETVKLQPMEEATLDYASGEITIRKMDDATNVAAWTTCKLRFNNASIDEVILEIEETYDCHLKLSRNLSGEHYTGVIPTDNILLAVSILEKIYNVDITIVE